MKASQFTVIRIYFSHLYLPILKVSLNYALHKMPTSHYRMTLFSVLDTYVFTFAKALIVLFCDVPLKSYSR